MEGGGQGMIKFIPENLVLKLSKKEVKVIVEYLTINQELNENLIKKMIKFGNKIEKEEK